jgi:hypothetical protein
MGGITMLEQLYRNRKRKLRSHFHCLSHTSPATDAVILQLVRIPHKLIIHNLLQNLVISLNQAQSVEIEVIITLPFCNYTGYVIRMF